MQLPVLAEALEFYQPYRLDVDYLIIRFVVYGAAVYGLRRLVHEFYVKDLRVYLLYTVALAVSAESVYEDRDVRSDERPDQVKFVMLTCVIRSVCAFRRILFVILRKKLADEVLLQIGCGFRPRQPGKQRPAAYQHPVDLIVVPSDRPYLKKDLFSGAYRCAVGKLHISAYLVVCNGCPHYLLGSQPVHFPFLTANRI